jgi:hypothetical protein
MPNAKVNITIKTFRKVASTTEPKRYCAVDVAMPVPHDNVIFHQPNVAHPNGKFVFTAPATLEVRLLTGNNTDAVFVPLAVAFRRAWNCELHPDCDPMGKNIFETEAAMADADPNVPGDEPHPVLRIKNKFNHPGGVVYEFFILVQREEDAALGLIDPDIDNED